MLTVVLKNLVKGWYSVNQKSHLFCGKKEKNSICYRGPFFSRKKVLQGIVTRLLFFQANLFKKWRIVSCRNSNAALSMCSLLLLLPHFCCYSCSGRVVHLFLNCFNLFLNLVKTFISILYLIQVIQCNASWWSSYLKHCSLTLPAKTWKLDLLLLISYWNPWISSGKHIYGSKAYVLKAFSSRPERLLKFW